MDSIDQSLESLAKAFLKLRSQEEIKSFLDDLFSSKELDNLANRWEIIKLLHKNTPYEEIERLTGASSATIAKMSQSYKYGTKSFKKVLDRLN